VLVLLAACAAHAAAAPQLVALAWEPGDAPGAERLVLRFGSTPPAVGVWVEPWGVSVSVPSLGPTAATAPDVRIEAGSEATLLRLERPGATLRGIRYGADLVVVSLEGLGAHGTSAYRIGIGDVLTVSVYKNPDLGGELTVGPDGSVSIPLVGRVPAQGRTEAEIASDVRDLLAKNLLVDPQVAVSVKTYRSQAAYVSGSVARGERVALSPGMTLKDVLTQAGVALGPGQVVLLTRAGQAEPVSLTAEDVEAGRGPVPRDGDFLTVQERGFVVLSGEVKRPGRVAFRPGLTLLEAIASVEGLTDWASKKDVRIRRTEESVGEAVDQIVNLKDVETGRIADPQLQAGDVVMVRRRFL
jgi:polysaccharide export outer membrane protein